MKNLHVTFFKFIILISRAFLVSESYVTNKTNRIMFIPMVPIRIFITLLSLYINVYVTVATVNMTRNILSRICFCSLEIQ